MSRWLWWFLLAPHAGSLLGHAAAWGMPRLEAGVLFGVFAALFVPARAVPGVVLAGAMARALGDGGRLPLHVLALGVPLAAWLPLCGRWAGRAVWWQAVSAAYFAAMLPVLDAALADWFHAPRACGAVSLADAVWAALLAPLCLWVLQHLPPCRQLSEAE